MNLKVLQKIQDCRASIKAEKLKKSGRNEYSKYDYYTPEQVDALVYGVCVVNKLFNKYELKRDEHGIYGKITVVDLESGEREEFVGATEMPAITATNATQQMGGCMTYTERYLLMFIYDIKDNNLDFDSQDHTKKPSGNAQKPPQQKPDNELPWLNKTMPEFKQAKAAIEQGVRKLADITKKYKLSKENFAYFKGLKVVGAPVEVPVEDEPIPLPGPYHDNDLPF